ncbi:MAG: SMC-Scp complex subunit ScpB [Erysipelotrichaceae bacterium]|nr:SMC-Scp complex subunit ScpB [Erysipelotrichaceae bacterium]
MDKANELNIEAIVEGLLYVVGDEGLKLEQLASVIERSNEDCEAILLNIRNKYASDLFGIELVSYGNSYKFVTKPAIYQYASKLFNEINRVNLSQSVLETLAIIAYKQPITRIEIEEIRGVSCDVMLRKLLNRNLIKDVGRSDAPGKPILYEVTDYFMDCFKLNDLKELPDLPDFKQDSSEEALYE